MREPDLFDQLDDATRTAANGSMSAPARRGADVLAFPLSRDLGLARKMAAAILKRRSPEAQQSQFERDAVAVAGKLRMAGLGEAEVARQIDVLTRAVNVELARLQMHERRERM